MARTPFFSIHRFVAPHPRFLTQIFPQIFHEALKAGGRVNPRRREPCGAPKACLRRLPFAAPQAAQAAFAARRSLDAPSGAPLLTIMRVPVSNPLPLTGVSPPRYV